MWPDMTVLFFSFFVLKQHLSFQSWSGMFSLPLDSRYNFLDFLWENSHTPTHICPLSLVFSETLIKFEMGEIWTDRNLLLQYYSVILYQDPFETSWEGSILIELWARIGLLWFQQWTVVSRPSSPNPTSLVSGIPGSLGRLSPVIGGILSYLPAVVASWVQQTRPPELNGGPGRRERNPMVWLMLSRLRRLSFCVSQK